LLLFGPGLVSQKLLSLDDSLLESLVGLHVLSDLSNWKLDEHTSNLWSLSGTNNHLNVLVDQVTDMLLKIWVFLLDRANEILSLEQVCLLWGHLLLW
jgi:hypothetical protein